MWSRKKRKKEAAAAAAAVGGAKEGAGSSNGSATTTTTANAKQALPDLSRSRSQSGSPMKDPQQQRSGSVGPRSSGGGDTSLSLANGSLQPNKPQGGPSPAALASQASQQHQVHNIPPHGAAVVVPPPTGLPGPNLKQYPLNQNHPPAPPIIPPTGGTGAVLPPQMIPHPVVNPSLHPRGPAGEPVLQHQQQLGVAESGEGVQVKQAHKTLAKSNIKPSLTVPLPTVPLSASILESLHEVSSKVDTSGTTSSTNNNSTAAVGAIGTTTTSTSAEQGQLKDPTNAAGALGSTEGGGGVGVMVPSSSQLQQVIDAQRTQLALLSQITQLVTDQKRRTNPQQEGGPSSSGGMMRGHVTSVPPALGGYPQKSSSIASRTQTFDYGNRSNKVLENAAVHQLEQDYYHGNPSGHNY